MGGFSVWNDDESKEIMYFNLPSRNRLLPCIDIVAWSEGTVWKCPDCMYSKIKKEFFIAGLENGIAHDVDFGFGKATKEIIQSWLDELIKKTKRLAKHHVIIIDELMCCMHERMRKRERKVKIDTNKSLGE